MIFTLITVFLAIMINLIVIYFIKSFDQSETRDDTCVCNNNDKFKPLFIKYYSILAIMLMVIIYILPLLLKTIFLNRFATRLVVSLTSPLGNFFISLFLAIGFFSIFFLFRYTKEKESDKCNCKTDLQEIVRLGLMYYSMIVLIIYIITTVVTFALRK